MRRSSHRNSPTGLTIEDLRQDRVGVDRPPHRGGEQERLRVEEMQHERGIDVGVARDRADRRAVPAVLGEPRARRVEDRLPGLALPGATAGAALAGALRHAGRC
jgi:hypothetical protein